MIALLKRLRFLFLFFVILAFCLLKAIEAQTGLLLDLDVILLVLILTSLVVISEHKKLFFIFLLIPGLIEIGFIIINAWVIDFSTHTLRLLFATLFFLVMTTACIRLTIQDKTIDITTLFGSLSAYLFIGLSFAYLYLFIYSLYPHSISGLEPHPETRVIYYSFVTLTTLGFGDIVATGPIIQCLTWMEAFSGQAYIVIFISQLVGRYIVTNK